MSWWKKLYDKITKPDGWIEIDVPEDEMDINENIEIDRRSEEE